jgi:molybdopterin synthase catalytic subunit
VVFEGAVRNHNLGRRVNELEYEAFDGLAVAEGEKVLTEARERFAVKVIRCTHRVGRLKVGEVAIQVVVASPHRQEAFVACGWIVDEIKARVPIWKKEHYEDGQSEWLIPPER